MPNIPLTLLMHIGTALAGVALLHLGGVRARVRPLLASICVVVAYWALSKFGLWFQDAALGKGTLHWNWLGKILVIAAALAFLPLLRLGRRDVGLTLRQSRGSMLASLAIFALLCGIAWIDEALVADGTSLSPERLVFQASMPGLDEELVFRGILFALLSRTFETGQEDRSGGNLWGAIFVTAFFAAGHAFFVAGGHVTMDWHALIVTGVLGAGFLWLRMRTGSLLMPVLAHNVCNFGGSFF